MIATFTLHSLSPLLMHSTAGMSVEGTGTNLRDKSELIVGQEEAEQGAYRNADGQLVLPTAAVRGALYGAASGRKIGKLTARAALAAVVMPDEYITLLDGEDTPITEYEVDTRFVRVGSARVPRSRAKVNTWSAKIVIEYDDSLINDQAILAMLIKAGQLKGVGDFRPSTGGGPFGRFTATLE